MGTAFWHIVVTRIAGHDNVCCVMGWVGSGHGVLSFRFVLGWLGVLLSSGCRRMAAGG